VYNRRRRHNPFGSPRSARIAVTETTGVQTRRRSKCKGCGLSIEVDAPFTKLRLKKRFRAPCTSCSHKPVGSKKFHPACVPTDKNAAMGYDPNSVSGTNYWCKSCNFQQPMPFGVFCPSCGKDPNVYKAAASASVAPPPKPKTAKEITLEAIVKFEEALVTQIRQRQKPMTPELEGEFKKFQGIKARILRPSTDGEEQAATVVGLQRLIKLVLS
jgi:hypothetical protein